MPVASEIYTEFQIVCYAVFFLGTPDINIHQIVIHPVENLAFKDPLDESFHQGSRFLPASVEGDRKVGKKGTDPMVCIKKLGAEMRIYVRDQEGDFRRRKNVLVRDLKCFGVYEIIDAEEPL